MMTWEITGEKVEIKLLFEFILKEIPHLTEVYVNSTMKESQKNK